VGGSCKGYPKPGWQTNGTGDGVRDIPDVSLFASNGIWGHYYVVCYSDIRNGGARCTGAPSGWAGAGGTSFASPIMAGIQALVNQSIGATKGVGNPAPIYYSLASGTYGSIIFNSVTTGDMAVNCSGTVDCYGATAASSGGRGRNGGGGEKANANGVLSTSSSSPLPAYSAGHGWNFATGIGSVNAANLVKYW
jgi:subtilase family serine protease